MMVQNDGATIYIGKDFFILPFFHFSTSIVCTTTITIRVQMMVQNDGATIYIGKDFLILPFFHFSTQYSIHNYNNYKGANDGAK
jgi:hypothetical protein